MKKKIIKVINEFGPLTQKDIVKIFDYRITKRQLRKLIHEIREEQLAPIISTNEGYKITYNIKELREFRNKMQKQAKTLFLTASNISYFIHDAQYRKEHEQLKLEV